MMKQLVCEDLIMIFAEVTLYQDGRQRFIRRREIVCHARKTDRGNVTMKKQEGIKIKGVQWETHAIQLSTNEGGYESALRLWIALETEAKLLQEKLVRRNSSGQFVCAAQFACIAIPLQDLENQEQARVLINQQVNMLLAVVVVLALQARTALLETILRQGRGKVRRCFSDRSH
jgi:hypothetical protein